MTRRPWLVTALLALGTAGCGQPAAIEYAVLRQPARPARFAVAAPARLELGRKIYNFRCYYCHGYSGNARTLAASFLEPPPRDFTATPPSALSRPTMLKAVREGRPGTAMKPFAGVLSTTEIAAVVDFVRDEFMGARRENTRYHTPANGWPDHGRYAAAFPFATGTLPLDSPWEQLDAAQQAGKRLYLSSCVSCHDRGSGASDEPVWESRPLSYPRNQFQPGQSAVVDGLTSASPYAVHERTPRLESPSAQERLGEALFQANCAFCHAADGTGKNWIGRFMEPHPRDLTNPAFMGAMTRDRLSQVIRDGLPNTSMPAWKSVLDATQIDAVVAYVARAFHPLKDAP